MEKVEQETEKYMQMDTNHDGKISFEEFYNFHLELNGLSIVEPIRYLDEQITTDLGQISKCNDRDRLRTLCKRVFDHIDADESGEIEPKEVKQFLQARYQIEFDKTKKMFNYLQGQLKKDALASVFK